LVAAYSLEDLRNNQPPSGAEFVVYDELGAGEGNQIAVSEGREASMPFYPEDKVIDAYNAAILDHIDM